MRLTVNTYKLSWLIVIVNFLLGIALGIYPNLSSSTNKKVDPLPFYIFSGLITLSSLGQASEKGISLIKNRGKLTGQDFVEKYSNILIESLNTIILLPLEKGQVETFQKSLLKSICALVKLYYDEKNGLKINANLMIPCEIKDEEFKHNVKFFDPLRLPNTYKCLLKLELCAEHIAGVSPGFALPVDKDKARLLFGAPKRMFEKLIVA